MGVTVSFDYNAWVTRYPEFASVTGALAQQYFNEATAYHANDGSGPVTNTALQLTYLNMLTAHIAKLNAAVGGQQASDLVGRISGATEGSVSVQVEFPTMSMAIAFFAQTRYGLAYWQATAQYRTMRYRVPRQRNFNPWPVA